MESKYYEINLLNYLPSDTHVFLNPEFRNKIFNTCIKISGTQKNLANVLEVSRSTIYDWKVGKTAPSLNAIYKCAKLAKISKEEIISNILSVTSRFSAGSISVNGWKLALNEEFTEWFGLLCGDGSFIKDVTSSNICIDVVYFFSQVLENRFGIPRNLINFSILVPMDKKFSDADGLIKKIKEDGYIKIFIYKLNRRRSKKFLITSYVCSSILSILLKNLANDLFELIKTSSNNVKCAYVRGFAAAEGCAHRSRNIRIVNIYQKDPKLLEYIKNLLMDIGITNVRGPIQGQKVNRITVSRKDSLERFYKLIGFGRHQERNEKLRKMIESYKIITPYQSRAERYTKILNVVKQRKKVTCKQISEILRINYRWTNKLMNELVEAKLLKVDTRNEPYYYQS